MNAPDHLSRQISREVDGELSSQERAGLEEELARSPEFRAEQTLFRRMSSAVREEMPRTAPLGLADRILSRIESDEVPCVEEAERAPGRSDSLVLVLRSVSLAAAILVLCGVGYVTQLPSKAMADKPDPEKSILAPDGYSDSMEELGGGADQLHQRAPYLDYFSRRKALGDEGGVDR